MELSQKEIRDIAHLGRIGITDDEVEAYQKDLSSVLQYFEKLQEVNTDHVEEIGHITGMTNVYREDRVGDMDDLGKERTMKNVRDVQDGYIKVKSIL